MSADLLAAFGDVKETVTVVQPKILHRIPSSVQNDVTSEEGSTWQPWPSPSTQSPSIVIQDNSNKLWRTSNDGNDVLFDAEDSEAKNYEIEDEFGDFEQPVQLMQNLQSVPSQVQHRNFGAKLLDLDDTGRDGAKHDASLHRMNMIPTTQQKRIPSGGGEISAASDLVELDEDWGQFEETENKPLTVQPQNPSSTATGRSGPVKRDSIKSEFHRTTPSTATTLVPNDDFDVWDEFEDEPTTRQPVQRKDASAQVLSPPVVGERVGPKERPTNVPPPALLLTLVLKAFQMLSSQSQRLDSADELGSQALRAYKVCARLIAGRSFRWKRDTILSQSMRIGAAGRSGGMKLTSLDKAESRKEDQEAEEAIACWSRHSHRLNAIISKAKLQKPPMSLSTNLVVRTAAGPDVLTANHACPICGLKRNERVNGIDVNVSDTFGDLWIEHWGHTDCHDFWYQYEQLLEKR